uniref:Peptidase S59 domain-containing protein n=1 Tax=Heterosigma akashiwo TaxID=2829 RepID=A0A7S3XQJ3_HETAK
MAAMGAAALAALPAFAVARRGVGAVRWEGGVDVRGLDLDALVAIEDRAVAVYEGVAEEEKPPRGRGLNRPALVTLEGVAPPAGADGAKFAAKVERRTRKMGAEFVGYDAERGVWRFGTQHF